MRLSVLNLVTFLSYTRAFLFDQADHSEPTKHKNRVQEILLKTCWAKRHVCLPNGKCVHQGGNNWFCKCKLHYKGVHCKEVQKIVYKSTTRWRSPPTTPTTPAILRFHSNDWPAKVPTPGPETVQAADPCHSYRAPCGKHGTCVPMGVDRIRCICKPLYIGDFCEIKIDMSALKPRLMSPCQRKGRLCRPHGLCINRGRLRFHCRCYNGYKGEFCKEKFKRKKSKMEPYGSKHVVMAVRHKVVVGKRKPPKPSILKKDVCEKLDCVHGNCVKMISRKLKFYCKCTFGWEGKRCTNTIKPTTPPFSTPCIEQSNCFNGKCIYTRDGPVCECFPGWTGDPCDERIHTDKDKALMKKPPMLSCDSRPCQNNGNCVNVPNTKEGYVCECRGRWTGKICEIPFNHRIKITVHACDEEPCAHGTCTNVPEEESGYHCQCEEGYAGINCDHGWDNDLFRHGLNGDPVLIQDDCQDNGVPCLNGHCVPRANNFVCACHPGWVGESCDVQNVCWNEPCQNNGTCTMENEQMHCACPPSFGGAYCQNSFKACLSSPCLNGGLCHETGPDNFRCICALGYKPPFCQEHPCDHNPCQHGGICDIGGKDVYICHCKPGFSGPVCQIQNNPCDSSPCVHRAKCIPDLNDGSEEATFMCQCIPGYAGKNCSKANMACARNPCANGGTCITAEEVNYREAMEHSLEKVQLPIEGSYECLCPQLYTGSHCEAELKGCTVTPCQNEGTCVELTMKEKLEGAKSTYRCECRIGFSGVNCEEKGTCDDGPCLHGGTCEDTPIGFVCLCKPSWVGVLCENKVKSCSQETCPQNTICQEDDTDLGYSCVPDTGLFDQEEVYKPGVPMTPSPLEEMEQTRGGLFAFGVIFGILSFLMVIASSVYLIRKYRKEVLGKVKRKSKCKSQPIPQVTDLAVNRLPSQVKIPNTKPPRPLTQIIKDSISLRDDTSLSSRMLTSINNFVKNYIAPDTSPTAVNEDSKKASSIDPQSSLKSGTFNLSSSKKTAYKTSKAREKTQSTPERERLV